MNKWMSRLAPALALAALSLGTPQAHAAEPLLSIQDGVTVDSDCPGGPALLHLLVNEHPSRALRVRIRREGVVEVTTEGTQRLVHAEDASCEDLAEAARLLVRMLMDYAGTHSSVGRERGGSLATPEPGRTRVRVSVQVLGESAAEHPETGSPFVDEPVPSSSGPSASDAGRSSADLDATEEAGHGTEPVEVLGNATAEPAPPTFAVGVGLAFMSERGVRITPVPRLRLEMRHRRVAWYVSLLGFGQAEEILGHDLQILHLRAETGVCYAIGESRRLRFDGCTEVATGAYRRDVATPTTEAAAAADDWSASVELGARLRGSVHFGALFVRLELSLMFATARYAVEFTAPDGAADLLHSQDSTSFGGSLSVGYRFGETASR